MSTESFPLAPMSGLIRGVTLFIFAIPITFAALTAASNHENQRLALGGSALALVLMFVWVWVYFRPTRFDLSADALEIVWPARRNRIPLSEIASAEVLDGAEFRRRFGWALRFGVGGLWGGYGHLWTREGTVRFYISRLSGYVLVQRRGGRPILITPERPELFCERLERRRIG